MIAPTVLLVTLFDDERSIYSHCLRAAGYEVLLADGPEHALTLAPTADVVVTRILQPTRAIDERNRVAAACQTRSSFESCSGDRDYFAHAD